MRCNFIPGARILKAVVIKLIDPSKLLSPDTCNEKMARSTEGPGIPISELNGGYMVQPVPAPVSTRAELSSNNKLNGNNQKLILFNLGKAMSGLPIITGNIMLPKPPIKAGITIKKIIKIA
eukprot:TRINITY_DN8157_c0_g1_i1.p8 TRINITY_DN8157_c0_g1~~TRINITY_DN8157_c0_g1_i1.p8  ORF type:complete len:121 (+),score=1.52 TRINITY_DN8157_c0_g1_i1:1247-1609(+)